MESYQRKRQLFTKDQYNTAAMIAGFVGSVISGKSIPEYNELFASDDDTAETDIDIYKEQFIDFALAHNKQIRGA